MPDHYSRALFDELCAYHHDLSICREYCAAFYDYDRQREEDGKEPKFTGLRRAIVDGIVVSYGRTFTQSQRLDGTRRLPLLKLGFEFSKPEWTEAHSYWMKLRDKAVAHTDQEYRQVRGELAGRAPSYHASDVTLETDLVRVIDAMAGDLLNQLTKRIEAARADLTDEPPRMPIMNGTRFILFEDPEWSATVPADDDRDSAPTA
ncbi:MAG: hypothetical protein JWL76_1465 [Thermoleophilia bacterium]|nr:hypothetical protein [Thermoleophilia bacterium]